MKGNNRQRIFLACIVIALLLDLILLEASRQDRGSSEGTGASVQEETMESVQEAADGAMEQPEKDTE